MSDKETARERARALYAQRDVIPNQKLSPLENLAFTVAFDAGWAARSEASAWVPIRSAEDLPKIDDCYETTQDLEDGDEPISWPLHYHAKTKQWFEDVDHTEPFNHPVLAWKERTSPYTADSGNGDE